VQNLVAMVGAGPDIQMVRTLLEEAGYELVCCERGIAQARATQAEVVVVDQVSESCRAERAWPTLESLCRHRAVIGFLDDAAARAELRRWGAYYVAPAARRPEELVALVTRVQRFGQVDASTPACCGFIGHGREMLALRASVQRLALSPHLDVIIKGERGSGRRTVARALHDATPGAGEFVEVGVTMPLEDAVGRKEPGTVYLGDLVRLSNAQQTKLYRALSQRRLGAHRRLVGALGDLEAARGSHSFVSLVDRFAVTLRLPPLRDRSEDLPLLVAEILARIAREHGRECPRVAPDVMAALRRYHFPGNVRELENALRSALMSARGGDIQLSQLPLALSPDGSIFRLPSEGVNLEALERDVIRQALHRAQGNRTRAASLLGLTRDQVRYRLSKIAEAANESELVA